MSDKLLKTMAEANEKLAATAQFDDVVELHDFLDQPDDPDYDEAAERERIRADREARGLYDAYPTAGTAGSDGDSWEPVDLGPYLRGEVVRPEPTVGLARSDGLRMLYPGKEHAVIGEMESGKSWFSLACVAAELVNGKHVVYLHFEEADPSDTVERLQALQVYDHDILKLFRFVAPQREVSSDALAHLLEPVPSLVVFDGVNEAMSLHRWGIREEDGAALFRRHLVMPCTRVGAATLSCDHVVKDVERRGRNALGSIHKGNGLSGSLIMLENAESFGRGEKGRSHVFVTKDRPGHLRRHGRPTKATPGKTFMGELIVDDRRLFQPQLDLKFFAPAEPEPAVLLGQGDTDESKVLAAVTAIVEKGAQASLRTIRATAGLGKDKVDGALERLKLSGDLIEQSGPRNARIFELPPAPPEPATVAQDPIPGTVS